MKTILLFDDAVSGHKYAFAKLFTKYLLRLNFNVILLLPEKTEQIKMELAESEGALVEALHPVNFIIKRPPRFNVHKKINPVLNCLFLWFKTKSAIRAAEKKCQLKVNTVFFCWLDHYLTNYLPHRLLDVIFPYPWSGLYFHPWYLFNTDYDKVSISSIDNGLRAKKCIGCGVHDETLRVKLQNRIQKPVLYFPEIADGSPPLANYKVAEQLRAKAGGKPIVGLIGLARRKGLLHLVDVISVDAKKGFFYFLAGQVPYHDYSTEEQRKIQNFLDQAPGNVYYFPDYIPEGSAINALISAFEIMYIVYDEFKSSSNFLTKAAIFKKLSVGSNAYWIGENIQQYSLGLTVSGKNPSETLMAFTKIAEKKHQLRPQWSEFLSLNGEEQLLSTFRKLLMQ